MADAGHDVTYVQNVTDVDDPLLERAARDGEDWRELAAREIELYRTDMVALRVLPPASFVGAVEAMALIKRFNLSLAGHGALYELDGDMYFARSSDPAFGIGVRAGPGGDDRAVGRARRRPGQAGEEGPAGRAGLARGQAGGAVLGVGVRRGPARLARGVRGDRDGVPGRRVRRSGRRH